MDPPQTAQPDPASHRLEIPLIVTALLLPTAVTWVYFVLMAGRNSTAQQLSYVIGKCVQFALPVLWVCVVCRRGLQRPKLTGRGLAAGALFGCAVTGAGYLLYILVLRPAGLFDSAQGQIEAKVAGLGIRTVAQYVALGTFYALFHSLLEEYYWRWFVYGELRRLITLPAAVTVSAVAFAAHHVLVLAHFFGWTSPATWLFSIAVAIGGAFWAWLYERSQTLTAPWFSHLLIDAGIFLIGFELIRSRLTI